MSNRELQRAAKNIRLKGRFLRGLLGDFGGTVEVQGRPGYFYVRVEKPGGYEVGIFPGRVRPLYNLPVRLETHPISGIQSIAGLDDETIAYSGTNPTTIPALELHAHTHSWGGDDMLMWLHTTQIFPMRCQPHPTTSTSVVIQAGTYFAEGVFSVLQEPLAVDLAAYIPSAGHTYILLYLDASGVAGVVDDGAQHLTDLRPAPSGTYWVAALRLEAGAGIGWQTIIDLRFMNSGVVNGGELELGDDYIVIGTDHPSIAGRWTRIGRIVETWHNTTRATGTFVMDDTDSVFFGLDRVGADQSRASIIWGDNLNDELWIAHYNHLTTLKTYVARLTSAGSLWILGNITLEALATVDGVDVGSHRHSGAAGDGVTLPFLNLSDTPASYVGQAGRVATVNKDESALIFTDGGGSGVDPQPIHRWHVDGALSVVDEVDGVWVVQQTFTPEYVWLYCETPGAAGSTIIDVEKSTSNGAAWVSIFAVDGGYPELAFNAGKVTAGAPDAIPLYAGTLLRVNITQVATGVETMTVQFAPVDVQPTGGLLTIMGVG